jgi:hypothetical protein
MINKILLASALFCLPVAVFGQNGEQVFNDNILHKIELSIDLLHWFDTLELDYKRNQRNPEIYPEVYRPSELVFDGVAFGEVGFREKGAASNQAVEGLKQPYKIKFDEFMDKKLDGLKRIDLKNFHFDPSLVHESMAYKLFRDQGIAAPRTAFAELWVNAEYIGVFLMVENIDKPFMKRNFGGGINDEGNIFKPAKTGSGTLSYLDDQKETYKDKEYVLNNNEDIDDWSGFINFLDVIENTPTADIPVALEGVFDVQTYLKVVAIEALLHSWDSYSTSGINYFLYEHPDGRFRYIPWDYNEVFMGFGTQLTDDFTAGYLVPSGHVQAKKPLLRRIFEQETWRTAYLNIACDLMQHVFTTDSIAPPILRWQRLVDTAYFNDSNKLDTYADFLASSSETHTTKYGFRAIGFNINLPGLFPFVRERRAWAVEQMQGWGFDCDAPVEGQRFDLRLFPNPAVDHIYWEDDANSQAPDVSSIRIVNALGQTVFRAPMQARTGAVGVRFGDLPAGFYVLLKESAGGDVGVGRFLVR